MPNCPIKVLLVDDDEDYYILTRSLLSDISDEQYCLDWQATYPGALKAIQQDRYDVCLLDYHLAQETGLDLLRDALANGCQTPMIMLTGQSNRQVDLEAMRIGAADYLAKGNVDSAILERSIRYAIDRAQTLQALRDSQQRIAELYQQEQDHNEALKRAYTELQHAETLRDNLTHMIVHDLRNPLTALNANLQLIEKLIRGEARDNDPLQYVARARIASQRMMRMIDDLLNVGKFEAGELRPVRAPISLTDLLNEKVEAYRAELERDNKSLAVCLTPELSGVIADANLLSRVIDNIISNALKYTGAGGRIEINAKRQADDLVICIRDDGQGIPPEHCSRIFDKFFQVTTATGEPLRHGTGLGLTFCRIAVEAHGGKIWVESAPQQGSAFYFTLPLNSRLE